MRRKDREMNKDFAISVVDECEWAVISMIDSECKPYCIPVSIVRYDNIIYFHSAMNGLKIDYLKNNNNVSIACVGKTQRLLNEFTTEYESALVRGKAYEVLIESEKIFALKILCERHTPTNMANFDDAIKQSLSRTAVWKIEIEDISGKRKKYGKDGKELKFGKMED